MRLNWCDDEERPGQFALWEGNCQRSLKGKAGQRALKELEAALVALAEKRLIHGALVDDSGGVCAVACYAKAKGLDLSTFNPEDESDEVGIEAGMPKLVAWKVVAQNDVHLDRHYVTFEGPREKHDAPWTGLRESGGYMALLPYTPEERYEAMLAWVREQLT